MNSMKNIGGSSLQKVFKINLAKDFISKLLVVNPLKRMTAKEALAHPWMKTNATVDLLPNVKKNARLRLKRAIFAVAAMTKVQSTRNLLSASKEVLSASKEVLSPSKEVKNETEA